LGLWEDFMSRRIFLFLCFIVLSSAAFAQTTAFNYQGKLTDAGNPANGNYLLQFKLYDVAAGGNQIGSTLPDVAVTATAGVFTAPLDFTATPFTGADRFLEISVKKNAADPYITLSPRQQINSSPYSIRTLSAAQADVALDANKLGGVDASEYVTTATVGSSFIKNNTDNTVQQTANFNISGDGIVGGSVGVGTSNPQSKLEVQTPSDNYGITYTNGMTRFNTYINSSLGGAGGIGTQSNHPLFFYANNFPRMFISPLGNVGIGTTSPQARFHVSSGSSWFQGDSTPLPASAGKGVVVGFSGEQGYIQAFDYSAFTPKNLLLNNSGGNVGIGTANPNTGRMHVVSSDANVPAIYAESANRAVWGKSTGGSRGVFGESNSGEGVHGESIGGTGVAGFSQSSTTTFPGVYGGSTGNGGVGVKGEGTTGVFGKTTSATGVGVTGENASGNAFAALGNAFQSRDKGGWVKAMALVRDDNTIIRCYNSQAAGAAVNTPPCGMTVIFETDGNYLIDFGFFVSDRFISLTPRTLTTGSSAPIDVSATAAGSSNGNQIRAYFRSPTAGSRTGFYILVY
jgi:hypothetical protein